MPIRIATIRQKSGTSTATVDVPDPETGEIESMQVEYRPWEITPAFWELLLTDAITRVVVSWDLLDDEDGTICGVPNGRIPLERSHVEKLPSSFLRLIMRKIREDNALGELSASS